MIDAGNVNTRLASQPSLEECVAECGVAIDAETALSITAFCWSNGLDVAMVAFDMTTENGE